MIKSYSTYLLLFLLVISCRESEPENTKGAIYPTSTVLEKQEYIDWCCNKECPLQKTKAIEDISYSLKYKPAALVACMEEAKETEGSKDVEKNIKELDGLDYYDFKIEITSGEGELLKYGVSSASDYSQRVNYFAFEMEKDIRMVEGSDTVSCVLFHFERAYDVIPYATFLLAFPKSKSPLAEKTFIYNDRVFNKGYIKITYTPEELSQIPKLKTI